MSAGYNIIRTDSSKTTSELRLEHHKISSQGVSEYQALICKWSINLQDIFVDNDLQNIWALKSNSTNNVLYCLRAGGVNQKIIDLHLNDETTIRSLLIKKKNHGMGNCTLIYTKGNNFEYYVKTIEFSEKGYTKGKEHTLIDKVKHLYPEYLLEDRTLNFHNLVAGYNMSNCYSGFYHPDFTQIPLFVEFGYGQNDKALMWDFENGFLRIETDEMNINDLRNVTDIHNKLMKMRIELPANNYACYLNDYRSMWEFSSDAISFGNGVLAFSPADNEEPQPLYPTPIVQKDFETKVKDDIDFLKGILREKFPEHFMNKDNH